MQTAIVILIIAVAVIFLVRRFLKQFTQNGASACGCSCDGCGSAQVCNTGQPK